MDGWMVKGINGNTAEAFWGELITTPLSVSAAMNIFHLLLLQLQSQQR